MEYSDPGLVWSNTGQPAGHDGPSINVFPRMGLIGGLQLGLRYRRFDAAFCVDAISWGQSSASNGFQQPATQTYQMGVKAVWILF